MRAVAWRLMPFLIAAYVVCYIDRVNVGFAALQMNKAVGIDPKTYGLGAGIFFVGYFLLEVPSNLALERFGARKWIARIMITWGMVSMAFALIGGPVSFLVLRFLLGAAEAGFFPGVILYLTYWFPSVYRAKIVGLFMVGIPVAGMIGSPLSGAILGMDGVWGLGGWQWIFILEALPAILLGVYAFVWLTDKPKDARWLTREQQSWLIRTLEVEATRAPKIAHQSVWKVMTNKYVLIMALVYAGAAGASTSLALWMPQLVKAYGAEQLRHRLGQRRALRHRRRVDGAVGPKLRPHGGARVAQRPAADVDGGGHGVDLLGVVAVDGHSAADTDRRRHLRQQGPLLGPVVRMAGRGRPPRRASRRSTRWAICRRSSSTTSLDGSRRRPAASRRR